MSIPGGSRPPAFDGDAEVHDLIGTYGGEADYFLVLIDDEAVDAGRLDLLQSSLMAEPRSRLMPSD